MSEDDKLSRLSSLSPPPRGAARQRALETALLAFDAAQAEKTAAAAKGTGLWARLRSIVQLERGTWIMNSRLSYGIGTAAVALLLLPLGYQLYTSTALSPLSPPTIVAPPVAVPRTEMPTEPQTATLPVQGKPETAPKLVAPVEAEPAGPMSTLEQRQDAGPDEEMGRVREVDLLADTDLAAKSATTAESPAAPPALPQPQIAQQNMGIAQDAVAGTAATRNAAPIAGMTAAPEMMVAAPPPTSGLMAPAPSMTQPSGDQFAPFAESPVKVVAEQPVSTFSIDVDTASYSYVRNALGNGWVPEPDAVRIEELINYFNYAYPAATEAGTPFQPTIGLMPTPWNPKTQLLQIGIKGYVPPATEQKPANLVFLIDTSGSMDEPDKLPLLKRAFALLVNQLKPTDTVSIVVYAGSAGVVLEPTRATEKARILGALENLAAGGSTAGAEGIELAYRMAEQARIAEGTNRVILATDGDFNVGIEDPEDLKDFIKRKRETGVFLSVLGFGQGNLGDDTMQALAQNGNGNAAYIDSFREAQKVLVEQVGGTLETIAKDVKIQVEFNPAFVSEYRLIGYETRALNREDFNNDRVDAGDVGAGTTVTALYEITPTGSGAGLVDPLRFGTGGEQPATTPGAGPRAAELGYLKLRYKLPQSDESQLMELPITPAMAVASVGAASNDQRFAAAVAAFGQKLKGSSYGGMGWTEIQRLAQGARGTDESGYRAEFMQLISAASTLQPDEPCPAAADSARCR